MRLPELNADHFQIFAHWLYEGDIDCDQTTAINQSPSQEDHLDILGPCYILGDKLGASIFKNKVIDKIIASCFDESILPGSDLITLVYRETQDSTSSKLRKLMVDLWVWSASDEAIKSLDGVHLPSEFGCEAFKTYIFAVRAHGSCDLKKLDGDAPFLRRKCETYHEHVGDEEVTCASEDREADSDDGEEE